MNYIIIAFICLVMWSQVFVDCMSLNSLKHDYQISKNKRGTFEEVFWNHYSQSEYVAKDIDSLQGEEQFLADPCFQHQMHLDITFKAIITIPKYIELANRVKLCNNDNLTISKRFQIETEVIKVNEIDASSLEKNLLPVLLKQYRGFIIICSQICTTLMLNVANHLGFGGDVYTWFTIGLPVADDVVKFPNDSIAVTHVKKHLEIDEICISCCTSRVKENCYHILGIQSFS